MYVDCHPAERWTKAPCNHTQGEDHGIASVAGNLYSRTMAGADAGLRRDFVPRCKKLELPLDIISRVLRMTCRMGAVESGPAIHVGRVRPQSFVSFALPHPGMRVSGPLLFTIIS